MELTSKQRAQLRGLANSIDTILQVGKDGLGENLIKQANDALEARELIKGRVLDNNIEYDARLAAEERAREEKDEEKQRKEKARLERARRAKEDKKGTVPEGVNKDDSREGLRAYARGRAYVPNRYGEVTEYVDPNTLAPVDKKARKEQEKKALAEAEVKVTEKMDLTSLNKKNDEPDAGKESV